MDLMLPRRLLLATTLLMGSGCDVLLCLTTGLCAEGVVERREPDDDGCFFGCSVQEHCVDGQCVECVADDECQSGMCEDGLCVECRSGADCSGDACVDNVCVECEDDDHCGPSEVCIDESCVEVSCTGIADPTCTTLSTTTSDGGYLCSTEGTCSPADDVTGCATTPESYTGGPLLVRASLARAPDRDGGCDDRVAYTASFAAVAPTNGLRVASVAVRPFVDVEVVSFSSAIVEDEEVGEALLCLPDEAASTGLLVRDINERQSNTVCLTP